MEQQLAHGPPEIICSWCDQSPATIDTDEDGLPDLCEACAGDIGEGRFRSRMPEGSF